MKEIVELLIAGEYLEVSEGRYPLVGLGPRAREAATDEFSLYMKRKRKTSVGAKGAGKASVKRPKVAAVLETDEQREMFERLRALRKRIADAEGVPPYIVFSDAALRGMCVTRPQTDEEMLSINGVGPAKLKRYGRAFMDEMSAS